jgi:predicted nucleic acid-binding protein
VPIRLIDSSVWIEYLRARPRPEVVRAVRAALAADEAAVAAPIVVEVLSGIRDAREYIAREAELRALHHVSVDGDAGYIAARIGKALADAGKMGKTVNLMLAGAAINTGAELWSLRDEHYEDALTVVKRAAAHIPGSFRVRWLS